VKAIEISRQSYWEEYPTAKPSPIQVEEWLIFFIGVKSLVQ